MTVDYRVGDALEELSGMQANSAAFVHLDDAWARPNRNGAFGVTYPTHPFDEAAAESVEGEPRVETTLTVVDMIEACRRVLRPGGVLAVDTDSYLLLKVLPHIDGEWSPTCFALAQVTALTKDGDPDRSTPGMYLSTGGYTTVMAWKRASPVPEDHPLRRHHRLHVPCRRQREDYGWGSVKPLAPLVDWIDAYTDRGERVVVPCAGTAPAAIAAELAYGREADVVCVDVEPEAKQAYQRRRADELDRQESLGRWMSA